MPHPHIELNTAALQVSQGLRRRSFLMAGLALASGGTALLSGCGTAAPQVSNEALLTVIRRLIPVALPPGTSLFAAKDIDIEGTVNAVLKDMSPQVRSDLNDAATLFEYSAGISMGVFHRFSGLDDARAVQVMDAWQNGSSLQRGIATVFKKLVYLGYWRDSRTWGAVQFDGPVSEKWGLPSLGNAPLPADLDAFTGARA